MKELQLSFDREGKQRILSDTINFGDWDIALGGEFTFYIHNPNDYAKAVIKDFTHSDKRVIIVFPGEVGPLQTEPIKITLPSIVFETEEQERDYFKDVFDQLVGEVRWKRP